MRSFAEWPILHTELVVTDLAEDVSVAHRNEVIGWYTPPLPVSLRVRFSESRLSSSNLPSLTFSQGLPGSYRSGRLTDSK